MVAVYEYVCYAKELNLRLTLLIGFDNALRITCKSGHEPDRGHEQILSGESAGCEARSGSRPVDGIRSALSRARSVLDNKGIYTKHSRKKGRFSDFLWIHKNLAFIRNNSRVKPPAMLVVMTSRDVLLAKCCLTEWPINEKIPVTIQPQ